MCVPFLSVFLRPRKIVKLIYVRHVLFCHFLKRIISHPSIACLRAHSFWSLHDKRKRETSAFPFKRKIKNVAVSSSCTRFYVRFRHEGIATPKRMSCSPVGWESFPKQMLTLVAPLFCEKKSHKRRSEQLSRCSFSAFSTSVYSKADAPLFGDSFTHSIAHQSATKRSEKKTRSMSEIPLRFHRWIARRDKITIIHSFNVNSSPSEILCVVVY